MENSVIVGLITFFLGLFLGHRLSLGRDIHKEFNDIAQPIRESLLKERTNPSPYFTGISEIDADRLESVLHWWQRSRFRNSLNAYHHEKKAMFALIVGAQ